MGRGTGWEGGYGGSNLEIGNKATQGEDIGIAAEIAIKYAVITHANGLVIEYCTGLKEHVLI